MGKQFLDEIITDCNTIKYCGSFSGLEFVNELFHYNTRYGTSVLSPYEFEWVDSKGEEQHQDAEFFKHFDKICMIFDETFGTHVRVECYVSYKVDTDIQYKIPWRGWTEKKYPFAEYIYRKYVKKEVELRSRKNRDPLCVKENDMTSFTTASANITTGQSINYDYGTTTSDSYIWTTNVYEKTPTVTIDGSGLKIGDTNVGDYIKNANPIDKKKGDNKMSMFNFDFGPCKYDTVRLSMYGIAIKNKDGHWVSYDSTAASIVDVEAFNMPSKNFLYKVPVSINDVKIGDVVVHNKVPMFVRGITETDNKITGFTVIDPYAGEQKNILPTKNMFNFNFMTKIVSLADNFGGMKASEDQPFGNMLPFMFMTDGELDPMVMMLLMNQTKNGEGFDPNILLALSMSDKDEDGMKYLIPMMLAANLKK